MIAMMLLVAGLLAPMTRSGIHLGTSHLITTTIMSLQPQRASTSRFESISESQTTSLPPAANTMDALFTVARTQTSLVLDLALFTQIRTVPIGKLDSQTRNARRSNSTSRTTLLFVAITAILVLSWVPYWLTIFAETYVGLIGRHLVYFNNCTNFLVFAMNPRLRQEMVQVVKRYICCRTGRT